MRRYGWRWMTVRPAILIFLAGLVAAGAAAGAAPGAAASAAGPAYWCVQDRAPWGSYRELRRPLPHPCLAGYVLATVPAAGSQQLVTVAATAYRSSTAVLSTFAFSGGRWRHRSGPWAARIGADGMAPPGHKTEGDLRTPQGTYGFGFMFGVLANPGVRFSWRHAYSYDYWDDDPASPRYNEWVDVRHAAAGVRPEPMHQVPVYDYAAVIAYNTGRVPGAGSAIFLHVGDGSATTGCVSLPVARLLTVLRWLNPARRPLIALRVTR